jgi:hypothetical protein
VRYTRKELIRPAFASDFGSNSKMSCPPYVSNSLDTTTFLLILRIGSTVQRPGLDLIKELATGDIVRIGPGRAGRHPIDSNSGANRCLFEASPERFC